MTYNFERKSNYTNISQGAVGEYRIINGNGDYSGDSRSYGKSQDYGRPKNYGNEVTISLL